MSSAKSRGLLPEEHVLDEEPLPAAVTDAALVLTEYLASRARSSPREDIAGRKSERSLRSSPRNDGQADDSTTRGVREDFYHGPRHRDNEDEQVADRNNFYSRSPHDNPDGSRPASQREVVRDACLELIARKIALDLEREDFVPASSANNRSLRPSPRDHVSDHDVLGPPRASRSGRNEDGYYYKKRTRGGRGGGGRRSKSPTSTALVEDQNINNSSRGGPNAGRPSPRAGADKELHPLRPGAGAGSSSSSSSSSSFQRQQLRHEFLQQPRSSPRDDELERRRAAELDDFLNAHDEYSLQPVSNPPPFPEINRKNRPPPPPPPGTGMKGYKSRPSYIGSLALENDKAPVGSTTTTAKGGYKGSATSSTSRAAPAGTHLSPLAEDVSTSGPPRGKGYKSRPSYIGSAALLASVEGSGSSWNTPARGSPRDDNLVNDPPSSSSYTTGRYSPTNNNIKGANNRSTKGSSARTSATTYNTAARSPGGAAYKDFDAVDKNSSSSRTMQSSSKDSHYSSAPSSSPGGHQTSHDNLYSHFNREKTSKMTSSLEDVHHERSSFNTTSTPSAQNSRSNTKESGLFHVPAGRNDYDSKRSGRGNDEQEKYNRNSAYQHEDSRIYLSASPASKNVYQKTSSKESNSSSSAFGKKSLVHPHSASGGLIPRAARGPSEMKNSRHDVHRATTSSSSKNKNNRATSRDSVLQALNLQPASKGFDADNFWSPTLDGMTLQNHPRPPPLADINRDMNKAPKTSSSSDFVDEQLQIDHAQPTDTKMKIVHGDHHEEQAPGQQEEGDAYTSDGDHTGSSSEESEEIFDAKEARRKHEAWFDECMKRFAVKTVLPHISQTNASSTGATPVASSSSGAASSGNTKWNKPKLPKKEDVLSTIQESLTHLSRNR
ncbi:unnamed protein product [Amoebophrya sp. A120]|nr:unnamed protein product [Amoebophrya sp. A120]|eukprot:GSA120T00023816001.1